MALPNRRVFGRVDFLLDHFDRLLYDKGYRLRWEKSSICPCADENGKRNIDCELCKGKGFFYFDPKEIKGVITGLTASKAFEDVAVEGDWILGKSALTVRAENIVSFRDKITNLDSIINYSQLIVHKALPSVVDRLRYPAINVILLRTEDVVFVKDTDFEIDADGNIEWLDGGNRPDENEVFSILYTCHPVWIALTGLHQVRDTFVLKDGTDAFQRMPRQIVIELEFFANETVPTA